MCSRKVFIHHRCGHRITELTEFCGNVECRFVMDEQVVSNKYTLGLGLGARWGIQVGSITAPRQVS
ncbi:hypothetical protein B0T19DRAFT_445530 [Cercophora scortea]|uniref:Uncharacterized protein n=1 Tax=Cercophora scortea TaxID=314031 RepID=A0AAE0M579_9PEZI|nr:hypothetical protein B0T19DRAFT_445530 [Cercophora scortea]